MHPPRPFHAGPLRTIADDEYATLAGSTGGTTDACTRPYKCGPPTSTSKPTTLPSAESRNPYKSGREPVTVQYPQWELPQGTIPRLT
jgi:putative transposase